MGIFKKNKKQDVSADEGQIDPTKPLDNSGEEKRKIQDLQTTGKCETCGGGGLLGDPSGKNSRCENCQGTGKAGPPEGTYRTGTVLILKDKGTFIVNDYGQLVPMNK